MEASNLLASSPFVSLLGLALLLWFYTVWQSYVLEGTRARLEGLKELWRETLALDPAGRHSPAARTVERLLDAGKDGLPRLSLEFLFCAMLVAGRERRAARARVYEDLNGLPSSRLQTEAISIVETATRYVALAALKRSLLVWALVPLFVAGFVVWSVKWQLKNALEGAPPGSTQLARVRLRRKCLAPLIPIVISAPPA
jgi:hypothetical protein